jgi:hypothetical protein
LQHRSENILDKPKMVLKLSLQKNISKITNASIQISENKAIIQSFRLFEFLYISDTRKIATNIYDLNHENIYMI